VKVLVTGGSGVIGTATVTELVGRGHLIRLLARGAAEAHTEWQTSVEPFAADVGDASSVHGAAEGCAAVIHVSGIVDESPPEITFDRINVTGTTNMVREAERARVRRFIFVSSLGVELGESAYHRSKMKAEEIVRASTLGWTIARVGAVMGAGDETVSVLLQMVRALPVVPVIGDGGQPFQPIWHEDVGWALAECLERDDVTGRTLSLTGPDIITVREVLDLFSTVTDRSTVRLPLPAFVARAGSSFADAAGIRTPVSAATVQMLLEGSYLRDGEPNDLTERLGRQPVPTRDRLVQLADALPEQTPDEGVGRLRRRRFRIDIAGSGLRAGDLLDRFTTRFADLVPFEAVAEPGALSRLEPNATLTFELPARGHVQVRVEALDERSVTIATIEGHPLAGIIRFRFDDRAGDVVRFTIDIIERPATRFDQVAMALIGTAAQTRTWKQTAENVAADAGVQSPPDVAVESWDIDDDDAAPLEEWARALIRRGRREGRSDHVSKPGGRQGRSER
jgi:NADH dehydrogenase